MRVFLDANVLFSATHNPAGRCALLIELAQGSRLQLFTSAHARYEADRNLKLKYQKNFVAPESIRVVASVKYLTCPLDLPAKDQQVFMDALAIGAEVFLTGDRRHFGRYMNKAKETGGVLILTVAEFIDAGPY
jgi:predicted nucleic acid-binding protein